MPRTRRCWAEVALTARSIGRRDVNAAEIAPFVANPFGGGYFREVKAVLVDHPDLEVVFCQLLGWR